MTAQIQEKAAGYAAAVARAAASYMRNLRAAFRTAYRRVPRWQLTMAAWTFLAALLMKHLTAVLNAVLDAIAKGDPGAGTPFRVGPGAAAVELAFSGLFGLLAAAFLTVYLARLALRTVFEYNAAGLRTSPPAAASRPEPFAPWGFPPLLPEGTHRIESTGRALLPVLAAILTDLGPVTIEPSMLGEAAIGEAAASIQIGVRNVYDGLEYSVVPAQHPKKPVEV